MNAEVKKLLKRVFIINYQRDNPLNISGYATQGFVSKEEFVFLVKELKSEFFDLFQECRNYDDGVTLVSNKEGLEKLKQLIE